MEFTRTRLLEAVLICVATGMSGAGIAADDDYLRAIQAEGSKLERLNRAKEEISQSEKQEKTQKREGVLAKDIGQFEDLLRKDAPASFSLYSRLPAPKRNVIFDLYRKEGKLSVAKRKIVEAHLGIEER